MAQLRVAKSGFLASLLILLLSNELLRQDQSILSFHAQNIDVDEDLEQNIELLAHCIC